MLKKEMIKRCGASTPTQKYCLTDFEDLVARKAGEGGVKCRKGWKNFLLKYETISAYLIRYRY